MTRILTILGVVMLVLQLLGAFRYLANEWKLWRRGHGPMMRVLFLCCALASSVLPVSAYTTDSQEDICAYAAVLVCDNFEARTAGQSTTAYYKNNGWAYSCALSTCPKIIAGTAGTDTYEGTKSLQLTYPAGMNTGGGFLDSSWTSPTNFSIPRTVYIRWYQKHSSNFLWSYTATKDMEWYTSDGSPEIFAFWHSGVNQASPKQAKQYLYFTQQGSPWIPAATAGAGDFYVTADTWYCMETRYTINTTTTSTDGYMQVWVNDVKYWENPNVNLNNSAGAQDPLKGTLISGYWNCTGLATTGLCDDPAKDDHPLQYRWHDNLVVSSERIGCIGNYGGGAASSGMYIMILKSLDGIGQWIGLGLSAGGMLMRQSVRSWMWRGALASMAALLCLGVGVKSRILLSSAYVRHQTITVAEKYLEHVMTKKG